MNCRLSATLTDVMNETNFAFVFETTLMSVDDIVHELTGNTLSIHVVMLW